MQLKKYAVRIEAVMDKIELVVPTKEHEEQVMDYKKEFEINGDSLQGCAGLKKVDTYDEWLSGLSINTTRSGLVEASQYLAVRISDKRIVGLINIRHTLNDYLFQLGGHIGYSVRKSDRRKGYAKEMLRLALEKCKELNIDRVLVTCDKDNIASAKTITGNGGVLENEVLEERGITQRYWINL
jgi:predicted acetyltransferase